MKPYYLLSFCLLTGFAPAAQNADSMVHQPVDSFEFYVPGTAKTKIYLMDNSVVSGKITKITSKTVILVPLSQDTANNLPQQIPISQIKMIRVKLNAIGLGMAGGLYLVRWLAMGQVMLLTATIIHLRKVRITITRKQEGL